MGKKTKKKSKNKKGKNSKVLSKKEIKDLKKNLSMKIDNKKSTKSTKKKEKEKIKEIKKEIKEEKIIKEKIKEVKEKNIKENEVIKEQKVKKIDNGGNDINKIKKVKDKNIPANNNQTLLQLLNNKEYIGEITLNEEDYTSIKNNNYKKTQKKDSIDVKPQEKKQKNQIDDKNEYIKSIKSKIIMVNGKMVMQKPDVGLINKKYNEDHYNNILPMKTIFMNNEEKVSSLSFMDLKHTKKWTEEENKLFYKAIELFGLDFSMIEIVLKKRTRDEIKRKFLKEKKENFVEIEKAINSRKNVGKLKQILELYKNEKGQNYLGLFKEESFRNRRNNISKDEKIDYDKEYKNILNK